MVITRRNLAALVLTSALVAPAAFAAAPLASDALISHPASTLVGAAADRSMTVALALPLSDAAGAANFIAHVSKVGDPLYRAFLTPHEFARRFGADAKAYDALSSCAVKQGLAVGEGSISRTVLTVTGRTAQIEAAFGVKLSDYRKADGKTFFAADRAPTLSGSNAPDVAVSVLGMSSYTHFVPLARIQPAGKPIKSMGSGPGGACNAADLRTVFGASAASGWVQGNRRLV